MRRTALLAGFAAGLAGLATGPAAAQVPDAPRVALIKMPYTGARNVPERSIGPDYLEAGGIEARLIESGAALKSIEEIGLTMAQTREYGEWHRMGMANGHLAAAVADNAREGWLSVGLLANCTSVIGVLGGLQQSGAGGQPLRVGLVFIDAHGDFNTPETTLSGMLGGMPVAVSAGLALHNLRLESGLDPPLPTDRIVLGAVRDLDPLEAELIAGTDAQILSTAAIRSRSEELHEQMRRLSVTTDVIYVHIDMDVLDPAEVPGHPLTVPDGPTSLELAAALTAMFRYDKVMALGIASTPAGDADPDGVSRQAAYNLIEGALAGVRERGR